MTDKADDEQEVVPKLRFPEFCDAGGWVFKPLKVLAKRRNGRNAGEAITRVLTNSAELGVVDQRDYFEKDIAVQGKLESYFVVDRNDYVYNPRVSSLSPVGPIGKNKIGTGVMSPLYTVFRFDCEEGSFYEHFFRSGLWHGYMRQVSNSGARHDRMAISNDDFMEMPIPAPLPAEQKKISDCLSSVDALIGAEGERLAALRDHKKGLMQALFPAEGETTPRLRFHDDGEWALAGLPEVAFFQEGPGIMAVDFKDEGVPLVRLAGVSGTSVTLDGCNYLDPAKVEQKWAHFRLDVDDLVISTSATFGLVARVTDASAGALFYTGLIRFRSQDRSLDNGYLKAFLGSDAFARQVRSAAVGGGIKHFGPTHLKNMKIPLPQLKEQELVSDCVSGCDALIAAATQKLETLKAYKSGLTQQLFPPVTEPAN